MKVLKWFMKDRIMLEKLQTRRGSASILVIMLFAGIVTFIMMPILAIVFDRAILRLAIQDITDQLDLSTYQIYQSLELEKLSQGDLSAKTSIVKDMNEQLSFEHPQINRIHIKDVLIGKNKHYVLTLILELNLQPTLYRHVFNLKSSYEMTYLMEVPIDGEK